MSTDIHKNDNKNTVVYSYLDEPVALFSHSVGHLRGKE